MTIASSDGWNAQTWAKTLEELFRRASTDEAFRQKCLNNGNEAIEEISGVSPPVGKSVRFSEKLDELHIALPPKVPQQSGQAAGPTFVNQTCFPWGSN